MNPELENVTNEPVEEQTPVVNLNETAPVESPAEPVNAIVEETIAHVELSSEPVAESTPAVEPVSEVVMDSTDVSELTEEEHDLAVVEELPDFANLSKADLLKTALKALAEKELEEALLIFKSVKPYLDQHNAEEKAEALAKYLEEGGDKDGFEFKGDGSKEQFNQAFTDLRQRKEDARKRQEAEKLENLKKKEAILEEIKKLNDSEETTQSLKKLKELQGEWKKIKNVPKEHIEKLWESYRVLNEIFYDRLSINNELKDLDRSKNLDHKIELLGKANELTSETNIKKALIGVKKLQEDWRFIGPVAKEASDDIWNRFKAEVDKVYAMIKSKTEEMEKERMVNLEAKKELLEKAKTLANFQTQRIKEWMDQSNSVNELMEAWKKIGHVPMANRDQVWNEFRDARNAFFANKNNFFKGMHAERNANLKAKEELCVKAETIAANPIDWNKQTDELKKLQEAWKKIGQAPEKVNDAVWRRFRTACDSFFEKKSERYASQQTEQTANLTAKQALIQKLEELSASENHQNIFQELKQIQTDWNAIGFVPVSQKEPINKKYNELLDTLYGKHKQLNKEIRGDRDKQNFELMAGSPNGLAKLQREERVLMERIRGLKKDMETWDNNLGFFKSGNAKNPLAEQIQDKINIAQKHVQGLEEKLKALKALRNKPAETTPAE
ncbi:MAG: hypothetical protein CFE21_06170 [Bacteroidetes bacterium B1(2017)]|nr:MAG: hypothetical protein CFE21_06170 [Bacteroidetes bacterium B1(2017)]